MVETEPASMVFREGFQPVKWFTVDNWCYPQSDWLVARPDETSWIKYDNDCERGKRASRALSGWSRAIVDRLHSDETLSLCNKVFGFRAEPDPELHGGGLHVTSPGGVLACHLDYARHPKYTHLRRAVNLIAFCHCDWWRAWGGNLYLADPFGKPIVEIEPKPGRLVGFETNDLSYHGVHQVTGWVERISVAAYLLAPAGPQDTRTRALFMPNRGM